MVGVLMALIDKTKNYLNVEEYNLYTFKHFKFNDVKEAVLEYRNNILKKYKNMYSEVLIKDFDEIFGDFEK
jgi:hypothetical protein